MSDSNLSFGSVTVGNSSTQTVTLTSTGTAAVTINSVGIAGAGFTVSGGSFPATLNPNQTLTLTVQFAPTSAAADSGSLTVSDSSTNNPTAVVALSGSGTAASTALLSVSSGTLSFGSVTVGNSSTQTVTLTSTGTAAVTINSVGIAGAGFTVSGGSFPATLNPNQTLTLTVQFAPTSAAADSGSLTVSDSSTNNPTAVVALSGSGGAVAHEVDLSWSAPSSSPAPVVGYNIYRAPGGSTAYQLLNATINTGVSYIDSAVQSMLTYTYVVTSVDTQGVESVASASATATIP